MRVAEARRPGPGLSRQLQLCAAHTLACAAGPVFPAGHPHMALPLSLKEAQRSDSEPVV